MALLNVVGAPVVKWLFAWRSNFGHLMSSFVSRLVADIFFMTVTGGIGPPHVDRAPCLLVIQRPVLFL